MGGGAGPLPARAHTLALPLRLELLCLLTGPLSAERTHACADGRGAERTQAARVQRMGGSRAAARVRPRVPGPNHVRPATENGNSGRGARGGPPGLRAQGVTDLGA